MKYLLALKVAFCSCLILEPVHAGLVGGSFAPGEGSAIRDITAREDGTIVACGALGESAKTANANTLLSGDHRTGVHGFVAEFSADLSELNWLSVFPAGCIQPNRIALGPDGTIAIGGKHLGGLAVLDQKQENWNKSTGALAKLDAGGTKVLWVSPGGPNQGEITGLDVDKQGRVFFAAGTRIRSAANYLLRKNGETGANEPWAGDKWCVYLHDNQEALLAPGQYFAFYRKAKDQSENGFGYDYDGKERGWGPTTFGIQGLRIGGNVCVLPDGDIIVSSGLQYSFRVNKRVAPKPPAPEPKSELDSLLDGDTKETNPILDPVQPLKKEKAQPEGNLRKGKSFPAFDYFLARYSPDGELRWSTNLYQPRDGVHTPDQKPIDLTYDPDSDSIYALVRQHGSNVYRFKGVLVGDTGNLMISWLGKVDAKTGTLQEGWYFQNNRHGKFRDHGIPKSPPYPKLAGNALKRVRVGTRGQVYVAGSGAPATWTSAGALQAWPADQTGGGNGVVLRLSSDLKSVGYATCLFTDAEKTFVPWGLAVTERGVVMAGKGSFSGVLADKIRKPDWATDGTQEGCLLIGLMK